MLLNQDLPFELVMRWTNWSTGGWCLNDRSDQTPEASDVEKLEPEHSGVKRDELRTASIITYAICPHLRQPSGWWVAVLHCGWRSVNFEVEASPATLCRSQDRRTSLTDWRYKTLVDDFSTNLYLKKIPTPSMLCSFHLVTPIKLSHKLGCYICLQEKEFLSPVGL